MYLGGGIEPYVLGGKLVKCWLGNPSATKVLSLAGKIFSKVMKAGGLGLCQGIKFLGIEAEFVIQVQQVQGLVFSWE